MLNLADTRILLERAVETQGPDFVYNPGGRGACVYLPMAGVAAEAEGNPQKALTPCLIGVVLDLAGETRHHDFTGNLGALVERYPDMLTDPARRFLHAVQLFQDDGETWGKSARHAERLISNRVIDVPQAECFPTRTSW